MPPILISTIVDLTVLLLALMGVLLLTMPSHLAAADVLKLVANENQMKRETLHLMSVIAVTHATAKTVGAFANWRVDAGILPFALFLTPLLALALGSLLVLAVFYWARHLKQRKVQDSRVVSVRRVGKKPTGIGALVVATIIASLPLPRWGGLATVGSYLDLTSAVAPVGGIAIFAIVYLAVQRLRGKTTRLSIPVWYATWSLLLIGLGTGVMFILNMFSASSVGNVSDVGFWVGSMWRGFLYLLVLLLYLRAVLMRRLLLQSSDTDMGDIRFDHASVPAVLLTVLLMQGVGIYVVFLHGV